MLERDPYPPAYIWEVRGQALYFSKRCEEAILALRNMRAEHFLEADVSGCNLCAVRPIGGRKQVARQLSEG